MLLLFANGALRLHIALQGLQGHAREAGLDLCLSLVVPSQKEFCRSVWGASLPLLVVILRRLFHFALMAGFQSRYRLLQPVRGNRNPTPRAVELGSNLRTILRTNVGFQEKAASSKSLKTVGMTVNAP